MRSNSFIEGLIKQKNGIQIDFIKEFNLDDILCSICSFLNSDGGWILIGYSKNKSTGIENFTSNLLKDLEDNIADRIFPRPLIYIQSELYKDKTVVLINVLKGSRQPYSFDNKFYTRIKNQNKIASADDVSLMLRSPNNYSSTWEKLSVIDATFVDLLADEITETITYANKVGRNKSLPNNSKDFLSYFQLFDLENVKNGAVILFGKDPIKFLPQCRIRITVMLLGKTSSEYSDTVIFENNIFVSFQKIQEYFKTNIPIISEFKSSDWDRISREKYPLDALDEAIVNAMVHRDYGDFSGEITINIYSNKIEIINSGEIPPNIIVGKSSIKAHHSVLRNPIISHMFFLRGKMEKQGRGLSLIKERFVEHGLKSPEWSFQNGYTTLTLFSEKNKSKNKSELFELNKRQLQILTIIKENNIINANSILEELNGKVSDRTIRSDLKLLVDNKYIIAIGNARNTEYKFIQVTM
jgi:ATP-dependent DNA helicase RecG